MKSFFKWLSKPYHFNPSTKYKFKLCLVFGLFTFVFLYIFKPFTLTSFEKIILEYTFGIGVITFLGSFFMLYVPPLLFKNYFDEDKWTIGKNIVITISSIFFIGSFLWYFGGIYKASNGVSHIGYFTYLLYTFLVGTIPVFFLTFISEKNNREKREKVSKEIMESKTVKEIINYNQEVSIYSKNKKSKITFELDKLIYITTEGNYCSFFIKKTNKVKEVIIRNTLNNVSNSLSGYKKIIRCHRSYIINTKYVNSISGNGRGYYLHNKELDLEIPVSRTFKKDDIEKMI